MVASCHPAKAAVAAFTGLDPFFMESLERVGGGGFSIGAEVLFDVRHHSRRVQGEVVIDGSCPSQEVSCSQSFGYSALGTRVLRKTSGLTPWLGQLPLIIT